MKRVTIVPLLLLSAVLSVGCVKQPATITNLPTGVSQPVVLAWGAAVDNFHQIETARHTADAVLRPLVLSKVLPVSVLQGMEKIDGYALNGLNVLDKSPNSFSQSIADQLTTLASSILTELAGLSQPGIPGSAATELAKIKVSATTVKAMKGVQ